jgi:hypothetical protein
MRRPFLPSCSRCFCPSTSALMTPYMSISPHIIESGHAVERISGRAKGSSDKSRCDSPKKPHPQNPSHRSYLSIIVYANEYHPSGGKSQPATRVITFSIRRSGMSHIPQPTQEHDPRTSRPVQRQTGFPHPIRGETSSFFREHDMPRIRPKSLA